MSAPTREVLESTTPATSEPSAATSEAPTIVHAPGLGADELLASAGVSTFLADHELRVASIDVHAMERWFTRRPSALFLYAERPIDSSIEATARGECHRVRVADDVVLNQLSVVLARRGSTRVIVELGQERVAVAEQRMEERQWHTQGVRGLPMGVVAWDDAHIAYAEGAAIQELACVPQVREVLCPADAGPGPRPRGYCLHDALVVRPWRAAFVPHVGPVGSAYPEVYPSLPAGSCEVECEPSACAEALARAQLPRVPLHSEQDPVLAVFRTQSACRAFAGSRGSRASDATSW